MIDKQLLTLAHNKAWSTSKNHIRDDKSGIDIFIFDEQCGQVINILGSEEPKDWFTNFTFALKSFKRRPEYARKDSKIKAHSGYLSGWERIREQVLSKITSKQVLVTGFSMGGGVSNLVAVDIQYNNPDVEVYCVDFSGPRIWNKAGRDSYNKRVPNSVKFINANDIVPKIPPFFYYGGTRIRFGSKKYHWWKLSVKDHLEFYSEFAKYLKTL